MFFRSSDFAAIGVKFLEGFGARTCGDAILGVNRTNSTRDQNPS